MTVQAIKDCPNNRKGDVFELPDALGKVFVGLGLAQEVPSVSTPKSKPRTYNRRDLVAKK